jgi:arylsulfatase A-like enzyme
VTGFNGGYDVPFNVDGEVRRIRAYSTRFLAGRGAGQIKSFESDDARPWFLFLAPLAPHKPHVVEPRYRDANVGEWNGNPAVFEKDERDKPPYVRQADKGLGFGRRFRLKELRMLRSVDDLVDRVFRVLGETGERRRTLAFFLSDNGIMWAEHGLQAKGIPYLQAVRIPLYVRWPGAVRSGAMDRRLAATIDVAPTIRDAVGLGRGSADGRSLLRPRRRPALLGEAWGEGRRNWASLLTSGYQYTEYFSHDGSIVFREYYDLRDDPWQLRNLLRDGDPQDPPVGALHARLHDLRSCRGTGGDSGCP